jgi:hypothetical protein
LHCSKTCNKRRVARRKLSKVMPKSSRIKLNPLPDYEPEVLASAAVREPKPAKVRKIEALHKVKIQLLRQCYAALEQCRLLDLPATEHRLVTEAMRGLYERCGEAVADDAVAYVPKPRGTPGASYLITEPDGAEQICTRASAAGVVLGVDPRKMHRDIQKKGAFRQLVPLPGQPGAFGYRTCTRLAESAENTLASVSKVGQKGGTAQGASQP